MTASSKTAPAAFGGNDTQPGPFIARGVSRDLDGEAELRERAARFFVLMSLGGLLLGILIVVFGIRFVFSL